MRKTVVDLRRIGIFVSFLALVAVSPLVALATDGSASDEAQVSPARDIRPAPGRRRRPPEPPDLIRSIDGSGNDPRHPSRNAANTPLRRSMAADYADGVDAMAGDERPSAREVSNRVCDQAEFVPNLRWTTDYLWQWGQFVDHDIDLTGGMDPPEPAPIEVPVGDAWFDPDASGDADS